MELLWFLCLILMKINILWVIFGLLSSFYQKVIFMLIIQRCQGVTKFFANIVLIFQGGVACSEVSLCTAL